MRNAIAEMKGHAERQGHRSLWVAKGTVAPGDAVPTPGFDGRKPCRDSVGHLALALLTPSSNDSVMPQLKTDLTHLPARARQDLAQAVEILREEFALQTARRNTPHLKNGRILKIILFGSYARGKQVVDPVGRYFSDYDILVIVDHEDLTDASEYWTKAEDRMVEMLLSRLWPQPLNLIIHSLDDINHQLERGRYFFIDIVKDGIALFEEPGLPLADPVPLSAEDAEREAQFYFDDDFPDIDMLLETAAFQYDKAKTALDPKVQEKWRKKAVFNLHQATERAYYCILLVTKLYRPKSHNLNFLSQRCEQLDPRLIGIWQRDTREGKRCYELLRAAYIKARYSDYYKISDTELDWLTERIGELQALTKAICAERLNHDA
jgi:predicted nucleotidyltransferase/HEPN domain-containing protein